MSNSAFSAATEDFTVALPPLADGEFNDRPHRPRTGGPTGNPAPYSPTDHPTEVARFWECGGDPAEYRSKYGPQL